MFDVKDKNGDVIATVANPYLLPELIEHGELPGDAKIDEAQLAELEEAEKKRTRSVLIEQKLSEKLTPWNRETLISNGVQLNFLFNAAIAKAVMELGNEKANVHLDPLKPFLQLIDENKQYFPALILDAEKQAQKIIDGLKHAAEAIEHGINYKEPEPDLTDNPPIWRDE